MSKFHNYCTSTWIKFDIKSRKYEHFCIQFFTFMWTSYYASFMNKVTIFIEVQAELDLNLDDIE